MPPQPIHTNRLILIPFTLEATKTLMAGDTSILPKLGLQLTPFWPDQEAIDTFPKIIKNLELVKEPTGFESYMVVHRVSMTVIGDVGFKGLPNADGEVDIGYAIIAQAQNRGYGLETAQGLMNWAFQQPGVKAITARCLLGNAPSARVLVKLGMQQVSTTEDFIRWRISNPNLQPSIST
ncbi:ribosomal-protein-alanine N-acetyltransferase [Pontibacter aydingkolensis]|uniref:GNAT family N-acetyltransferase n=1 Tax=Pontibacter aydingkolensis TaxID=1911536 RepID=A0ABS7CQN1_9BACT|nr:GNAT family N-acetyltransferase [Pontibacter aydingkolensis]MBW7465837.1 GNAT family N-acetyltransferase [Pontibacter aydingkolensis]